MHDLQRRVTFCLKKNVVFYIPMESSIQQDGQDWSDNVVELYAHIKYEKFGAWLERGIPSDQEILAKAEKLGILDKHRTCLVLVQCIFDQDILNQIPEYQHLLTEFVRSKKHQMAVLGGVERLVGVRYRAELMTKVNRILLKLYDTELIDDDVFLDWGQAPSRHYTRKRFSRQVKEAAAPFLEWIRNAPEESSDEEIDKASTHYKLSSSKGKRSFNRPGLG
ncbi:armadillo-type protein [Fennellomyces sp. T-0311]|nr:armadillo-type protein [Fennellomyces sp. T-0311]